MSTYARGLYHRNVTRIVSLDSIRNLFKFLQAQEDCWAPSVLFEIWDSFADQNYDLRLNSLESSFI